MPQKRTETLAQHTAKRVQTELGLIKTKFKVQHAKEHVAPLHADQPSHPKRTFFSYFKRFYIYNIDYVALSFQCPRHLLFCSFFLSETSIKILGTSYVHLLGSLGWLFKISFPLQEFSGSVIRSFFFFLNPHRRLQDRK